MCRCASRVAAEQCPSRASMSTSRTMFTTSTTTTSTTTRHQIAPKSTTTTFPPIPGTIPSIQQLPPTCLPIMAITAKSTHNSSNCNCSSNCSSSKSRNNTRKRTAYLSWQSLPWRSLATSSSLVMPRAVSTCHSHPLNSHAQRLLLTVSERSYTFVKAVGDGSFGQVWLCDWHSHLPPHVTLPRMQQGPGMRAEWQGKRLVAIKRMKKLWEGGWDECKKHPEVEVSLSPPIPVSVLVRSRFAWCQPQMSKR